MTKKVETEGENEIEGVDEKKKDKTKVTAIKHDSELVNKKKPL
jgi:hypothetical protein